MEFENNKGCVSCILCHGINGTRFLNGTEWFLCCTPQVQYQVFLGVNYSPLEAGKQLTKKSKSYKNNLYLIQALMC